MTVAELVQVLAGQPQDAKVVLEGCDCVNDWDGRIEDLGEGAILLNIAER